MLLFNSFRLTLPVALLLQAVLVGLVTAKPDDRSEQFARLDENSDGQLTAAEISDEYAFLYRRLIRKSDSNSDGQLSVDEFQSGLSSERPEKPLTEKVSAELPGSDALLLLLVWMDENSDLTIKAEEVPANLKGVYDEIHQQLKAKDADQFRIRQLQQQSPRYTRLAFRYTQRQKIDVELELSLLSDTQYAMVARLRGKVEPGQVFSTRENAESVFGRLDRDGDGMIEIADLPEQVQERFSGILQRADQDGDQRITEAEFLSLQRRISKLSDRTASNSEVAKRIARYFRRADRDGDGSLTRREAPQFLAARFKKADSDGDGKLSRDELSQSRELQNSLFQGGSNPSTQKRNRSSKSPKS